MENYEFIAASNGSVIARSENGQRVLNEYDREVVEFVLNEIKTRFPISYKRLCNLYEKYNGNKLNYEFMMVKRFIRCNMGADDLMTIDLHRGIMNMEFVSCPLRGECQDEKVICCPRINLTQPLREVVELYAAGRSYKEIAQILGKSEKTIHNQAKAAAKALGLKRIKDIITYRIINNF